MVLDTINENGELIFKNTHRDNEQYTVAANDQRAPDEFYFIHIEPVNNQPRSSMTTSIKKTQT